MHFKSLFGNGKKVKCDLHILFSIRYHSEVRLTSIRFFIVLLLLSGFFASGSVALAAPNDTGTITVTGTIPPKGSNLRTQLRVSPSGSVLHQGQELTYTVEYTSDTAGSIPTTLQVEWGKGQVSGATEPSVDSLEYILGSASPGHSGAQPTIDLNKKTITWEISGLSSSSGTQYLTFKMRTTANYTGPLEVSVPVTLKVLSPIGVPDKTITSNYIFQRELEASTSLEASSAATTSGEGGAKNAFEDIVLQSVGKKNARISVTTLFAAPVRIRYGTSPKSLSRSVESLKPLSSHRLSLPDLQSNTPYYFQIDFLDQENETSDIFRFTTANEAASDAYQRPVNVTMTQQRSLIYSGPTNAEEGDPIQSVPVIQDSILDLSLSVVNDIDLKSVKVILRSANVLGFSTLGVNTDELQSLTTQMTQVSPSVYVGKVRTPPQPGSFQIISRIEDIYGNISEEEIGVISVVKPLTIIDAKTQKPIAGAETTLYFYNQQTKLFELGSNLTSLVQNPTSSDFSGQVVLHLPPARYLAKISAPGYASTEVEFLLSENAENVFPIVELMPTVPPVFQQLLFNFSLLAHELSEVYEHFVSIAQYPSFFVSFVVLQSVMLCLSGLIFFWQDRLIRIFYPTSPQLSWRMRILRLISLRSLAYVFESLLALNVISSYFFWQEQSFLMSLIFTFLTASNLVLWIIVLIRSMNKLPR